MELSNNDFSFSLLGSIYRIKKNNRLVIFNDMNITGKRLLTLEPRCTDRAESMDEIRVRTGRNGYHAGGVCDQLARNTSSVIEICSAVRYCSPSFRSVRLTFMWPYFVPPTWIPRCACTWKTAKLDEPNAKCRTSSNGPNENRGTFVNKRGKKSDNRFKKNSYTALWVSNVYSLISTIKYIPVKVLKYSKSP